MRKALAVFLTLWAPWCLAQSVPAETEGPAPSPSPSPAKPAKPPLDVSSMIFTADSIREVVAYHQDEIQQCYEELLAALEKPIEGRVSTSFIITPTGLVKGAKVLKKGTTLKDAKLHGCMLSALEMMEFPKPEDGESHPIEFPFNLKPLSKASPRP